MTMIYVRESSEDGIKVDEFRCELVQNYPEHGQIVTQLLEVKTYKTLRGVNKYFRDTGAFSIVFPKDSKAVSA